LGAVWQLRENFQDKFKTIIKSGAYYDVSLRKSVSDISFAKPLNIGHDNHDKWQVKEALKLS